MALDDWGNSEKPGQCFFLDFQLLIVFPIKSPRCLSGDAQWRSFFVVVVVDVIDSVSFVVDLSAFFLCCVILLGSILK